MPFDINHIDWVTLGVVVGALVVAWVILKAVLRITVRIFALGCAGLLFLAACSAVIAWLPR